VIGIKASGTGAEVDRYSLRVERRIKMTRILASDGMDKAAVAQLEKAGYEVVEQFYEPEELKEKVKEFDALVVRSATKVREPIIDAAAWEWTISTWNMQEKKALP
jgi:signal recognition particle GTPase